MVALPPPCRGAICAPQLPQKRASSSRCVLHCGHCIVFSPRSLFRLFFASLKVQHTDSQFHQRVIEDNQYSDSGQHHVNGAPRPDDDPGPFLPLQGLKQLSVGEQQFLCLAEINLLLRRQRYHHRLGGRERAALNSLQTIVLKRSGLTGAEPLDGKFQFQQAFLNSPDDTCPVGAGVLRDGARLPAIEQAPDNAAGDEKDEGKQRARPGVALSEATEILAVIVQDVRKVLVEQGDQNGGDANPGVQPEPVLYFAGQAARETAAQGIGSGNENQAEGDDTKET